MIKTLAKHDRGIREFLTLCKQTAKSGLPGLSLEVRRSQRLHLEQAMAAASEHAAGSIPVVAHRRNGQPWRIILGLEGFLQLYEAYLQTILPDPISPSSEADPGSDPDPDRFPANTPVP